MEPAERHLAATPGLGDDEHEVDDDAAAFVASRFSTPDSERWRRTRTKNAGSKRRREQAGKIFNFNKSSQEVQSRLLKSREAVNLVPQGQSSEKSSRSCVVK